MEHSVEVLLRLLAAAPDALLAINANSKIVFVNDQAERLFGWPRSDLLGLGIDCLVPERFPARHPSPRANCRAPVTGHPMGSGLRLSARRKDGSAFPAEISLSSVIDDLGAVLIVAAVRDATKRIDLEAQRQRQVWADQRAHAQRLESLGQLAGGVAHDFNNLLGVIVNYTTLLARQVTEPTAVASLAEIRGAAELAAGLTRQLLAFARRDPLFDDVAHPEALELNDIVRGVASMLAPTLAEEIELYLDLATEPLVTIADRHQLEQIVLNLMVNARDAMAAGGRLTIATARTQLRAADPSAHGAHTAASRVVLKVIDTGQGMSPQVAARAFEPFFTTKPEGRGTGLGLATVYGIVRSNGGEVTIDTSEGAGTTVTVVLPAADGATARRAPAREVSEGGREGILLFEDEDDSADGLLGGRLPTRPAAAAVLLHTMGEVLNGSP